MQQELKGFFDYVQTSTPLKPEGHVAIHWYESPTSTILFSDIHKKWFPDHDGVEPELRTVTTDEFSRQLAIVFWSCFGWPGQKPDSTQAQREFLSLLEEHYGLGHLKSSFEDDNEGRGEIIFKIRNDEVLIYASISWATD